jgi:hypothetical protein
MDTTEHQFTDTDIETAGELTLSARYADQDAARIADNIVYQLTGQ